MAINTNLPAPGAGMLCIPLVHEAQFTADIDFGAAGGLDIKVPFKCRVVAIAGTVRAIGGSTVFTDVDVTVRKYDGTTGTNLTSAALALVDSSAIVAGGAVGSLATTEASLILAANDRLQVKIDITGGSSPTGDGLLVHVYVVPLN